MANNRLLLLPCLLLVILLSVEVKARVRSSSHPWAEAFSWLQQYGYVRGAAFSSSSMTEEQARRQSREPLRRFKDFYSIRDKSDNLDDETIEMMSEPRCGQKDIEENGDSGRSKRYTFLSDKDDIWKDPRTPYPIKIGFKNYYQGLTRKQQEDAVMECGRRYAAEADLQFKLVDIQREVPNIEIEFRTYDGSLGQIGEALSPVPYRSPPTSWLRLDVSETWVIGVNHDVREVNLIAGFCHELGHSLNLGHSAIKGAIMYPSIQSENDDGQLDADDKRGIRALYGPPTTNNDRTTTRRPRVTTRRPRRTTTEPDMTESTFPSTEMTAPTTTTETRRPRITRRQRRTTTEPDMTESTTTTCATTTEPDMTWSTMTWSPTPSTTTTWRPRCTRWMERRGLC